MIPNFCQFSAMHNIHFLEKEKTEQNSENGFQFICIQPF